MKVGRIVAMAALGFFFLLFIAVDLLLFGVIELESILITLLPLLGLVAGGVLGALVSNNSRPAA